MNQRKKLFLYVVLLLFIIVTVPFLSRIQSTGLSLSLRVFLITSAIYILLEIMQFFKNK